MTRRYKGDGIIKFTTLLGKEIDDVTGLIVEEKNGEIISVKGYAYHHRVSFRISLSAKEVTDKASSTPKLRGTISVLDAKTGKVLDSESKKRKGAGDIKAAKDVKLDDAAHKAVAEKIANTIKTLWAENFEQLQEGLKCTMLIGQITPEFAIASYTEQYIKDKYSDSGEEPNKRRRRSLQDMAKTLPQAPMAQINTEDIKLWQKMKCTPCQGQF